MADANFTTYTETDPNSHITVTASKCDCSGLARNEDAYVHYDHGADYFDALDIKFEVKVTATSADGAILIGGLSNAVNDMGGWGTTGIWWGFLRNDPNYTVVFGRGGYTATDAYTGGALNTSYYCRVERAAGNDSATMKVYSDAARTNLLDTLTVAGHGTTKWRYSYGVASWNSGNAITATGYIQNLDLGIAAGGSNFFAFF